jgi:hypothetical protein
VKVVAKVEFDHRSFLRPPKRSEGGSKGGVDPQNSTMYKSSRKSITNFLIS